MSLKEELEKIEYLSSNKITSFKATYKKSSKALNISLTLNNSLNLTSYLNLNSTIRAKVKELGVRTIIDINYEKTILTINEIHEYLVEIVNSLKEDSPKFSALSLDDVIINNNEIIFNLAYDALGLDDLILRIADEFKSYSLDINVLANKDASTSVKAQIEELDKKLQIEREALQNERAEALKFNKESSDEKKRYQAYKPQSRTMLRDVPFNSEELAEFNMNNGPQKYMFEGYIVAIKYKDDFKAGAKNTALATYTITDETDTVNVRKWIRTQNEYDLYRSTMVENTSIRVVGDVIYDQYSREIIIQASTIECLGKKTDEVVMDDYPEKRVELAVHTKMSQLDGVTDPEEYVKLASKWGWKAIGLTDTSGVYAIPDYEHYMHDKKIDIKPIFGCEFAYVDDDAYFITFNNKEVISTDIDLKSATYVVYDIETTGFSQTYDRIIEISAYKVKEGAIVDSYETFVNPGDRVISEKITELTSIRMEDVINAKSIDTMIREFMDFSKDSILVAHNARFDVGMIYANIERLGLDYPLLPVIDTLNLFRARYANETKRFDLNALCKRFKVKQEHHHRASDDTRVTALCFIQMLNDLYQVGITNFKDINSCIDKNEHWKHIIPQKVKLLAKSKLGNRNNYKIVSDALTVHLARDAKALKSVINQNREGILVGSSASNGEIFELILNRSIAEAERVIEFYDYIEICPPSGYLHLYSSMPDGIHTIEEVLKRIIDFGKAHNKLVVAVSDCYYARPEDKKYREYLIRTKGREGAIHELSRYKESPNRHLRTTREMMEEFAFLGPELSKEVVITNSNLISDMIEKYDAFYKDMFAPRDDQFIDSLGVPSINEESKRIVNEHVLKTYGDNPHPIVKKRIERELNSIISTGYMSVYYISHLLVTKSIKEGYLVGSRGSVGSSLVATMMDITEVNPLKPHYRCKCCKFHAFKMSKEEIEEYGISELEAPLQEALQEANDGFDLRPMKCPKCGAELSKDGHDIPFETFLGFEGDKTPDIDLNFSSEYQWKAHEYIREVFDNDHSYRGGTVSTLAEKNAYAKVREYYEIMARKDNPDSDEEVDVHVRPAEIDRLSKHIVGVKNSTGQHPGGIVVVPRYTDIYEVTPFQFPADKTDSVWRTTHYDYHKFEANLLKFDILGHDDPTIIKYLMDYVHAHQEEFPFDNAQDIPIDDPTLYKLFSETDVIGVKASDLGSKVASYGVPELGTRFVQGMLQETFPKTFDQLLKISGLSHGTNVWQTNAQDLVNGVTQFGPIEFKDVIGCRDDIMVDLIRMGLKPKDSFDIMEFVRKGKLHKGGRDKWESKWRPIMVEGNIPEWYIWSCERIEYMFPKAHATAYVMMALRIAWFKVYSPRLFYSAWLSKRAKNWDVHAFMGGPRAIKAKIEEIQQKSGRTATDDDLVTALQIALEMTLRGIEFLPVDINKSSANVFDIEDGKLRIPFTAVAGLGESVALDIVEKRNEKEFTSIKDVLSRTRLNNTLAETFRTCNYFGGLEEEDKEVSQGIFAFLD